MSVAGIKTWLAASVDDRVAAAGPLIAVQSFRWNLETDRAAEGAFARTGSKDKPEVHVAPGAAHKVTDGQRVACVEFCVKWLAK